MLRLYILFTFVFLMAGSAWNPIAFWEKTDPVEVANLELSLPADSSEEFWYRFATEDEILLELDVLKGRTAPGIQVSDEFGVLRYRRVEGKGNSGIRISVPEEACFKIELENQSRREKWFRLKVYRIPASPAMTNFNPYERRVVRVETILQKVIQDTAVWETEMVTVKHSFWENGMLKTADREVPRQVQKQIQVERLEPVRRSYVTYETCGE